MAPPSEWGTGSAVSKAEGDGVEGTLLHEHFRSQVSHRSSPRARPHSLHIATHPPRVVQPHACTRAQSLAVAANCVPRAVACRPPSGLPFAALPAFVAEEVTSLQPPRRPPRRQMRRPLRTRARRFFQVKMNCLCMCHLVLHSSKLLACQRIVIFRHSALLGCEKGPSFACSTPITDASVL
jgi:hypothetical protein